MKANRLCSVAHVTVDLRPRRLCDGRYRAPGDAPLYDPVRSLVMRSASERFAIVGGQQIMREDNVLAFDYRDASARLQMAQRRAIEKVPPRDWAGAVRPRSCR
jgi:hypothetical protein